MSEQPGSTNRAPRSRATALFRRLGSPLLLRSGALAVLEVPGRRTGTARFTTIYPIEVHGYWYLVSQYGASHWVGNVRAAGRGALHRRGHTQTVALTEVEGAERAEVLAVYGARLRGPEGRDFRALRDADDHPTFRLGSIG